MDVSFFIMLAIGQVSQPGLVPTVTPADMAQRASAFFMFVHSIATAFGSISCHPD